MRTHWTTKGNRDAGSSCSCDRGLHRYLRKEIFLLGQRYHEDADSTILRNAGNITSTQCHIPEDMNLPPLCQTLISPT